VFDGDVGVAVITPEQMRGVETVEFLERATDLLEQLVFMIPLCKCLEFIID
jgi:hypothetical protein